MARIIWTRPALRVLVGVRTYLAQFDADVADRTIARLERAGNSLARFPGRGRPARSGTRELVTVPPYVIRYEIEAGDVYILHIRHGRQRG